MDLSTLFLVIFSFQLHCNAVDGWIFMIRVDNLDYCGAICDALEHL